MSFLQSAELLAYVNAFYDIVRENRFDEGENYAMHRLTRPTDPDPANYFPTSSTPLVALDLVKKIAQQDVPENETVRVMMMKNLHESHATLCQTYMLAVGSGDIRSKDIKVYLDIVLPEIKTALMQTEVKVANCAPMLG